jgi:hypothetical protein
MVLAHAVINPYTLNPPIPIENCLLCGCLIHDNNEKRYRSTEESRRLIIHHSTKTPFVYQYIANMDCSDEDGSGKSVFCVACVNWVRILSKNDKDAAGPKSPIRKNTNPRSTNARASASASAAIPLDVLIMFLHYPVQAKVNKHMSLFHIHDAMFNVLLTIFKNRSLTSARCAAC